MSSVERMFNAKAVALIGATPNERTVGFSLMKNLLLGKEKRAIYPVNPGRDTVMGVKCYPSIAAVPGHVDLAVIATPSKTVPGIVEECGQARVDTIEIISAGFREIGQEGARLEDEIRRIQARFSARILGPNCLGFIRPHVGLNATFLGDNPEPGQIAFVSQSGALGTAILNWAVSAHVGFSMFVSLGSMLDLDFGDIIDYLGGDAMTRSIILYMESIGNARKFMSAAKGFARTKPIIIIKAGKHAAGAKAASSHTGALAGDFAVYDAAFKRVGVVRVDEIEDLFNCASVLDSRYLPKDPRLAIVTNAGGPAVLASDSVVDYGGELARLSDESKRVLDGQLPPFWSHGNPVDVLGDADVKRYEVALKTCIEDPNVGGILVLYTPQDVTPAVGVAELVTKVATDRRKPILSVFMGEGSVREARQMLYRNAIPTYSTPEQAVKTYLYMYKYRQNLDLLYQTPEELPVDLSPPKSHLQIMIRKAAKGGLAMLSQSDADKFLDAYAIPRVKGAMARSAEEAVIVASRVGYPVVAKVVSQQVVHKTDVGGVVADIGSSQALREAVEGMFARVHKAMPDAKIDGVYIQKMVKNIDYELILGSKKDRDFGAVILFGLGGIGVELFKDVSIGLPPLNQVLARRIIEETRIYEALMHGLRNKPPADLKVLEEIMVRFSNMVADFPEIAEMDINPLVVSEGRLYAVDTRIIVDPTALEHAEQQYSHLVIMPYPSKYVTPWRLKDGTDVILRPIRPEDEPMESEFVKGLSERTSRFRFFQIIKDLPHDALVRFCNIDYDREMAFIAEVREGEKRVEIGVARLIIEPNRKKGEFAVVVADKYQEKGLGTKLVDMLISVAEEKGLESVYGIIMPDNVEMLSLCEKLGFTLKKGIDEVYVELRL